MPIATAPDSGVRWRISIVLAVTVFVNFLDRNNLALAMPHIAQEFGWSDREIGANGQFVLAAFFLSYALSNMGLSPLAERFGAKRSLMVAIAAFSLFTILTAPLGQSLTALIILRLLLGLGEGVHIPMLSAITSRWFPMSERSRANAIWGAGITLAIAAAPLIIVPLSNEIGWRTTFAVLGAIGLLISIPLVWLFVQDEPSRPARLGTAEFTSISAKQDIGQETSDRTTAICPTRYRRDPRFWLVVLAGTLNSFCAFGTLNWLPTYFNRAKAIDFDRLGWPLALVFTAGILGIILMAYLGDKLQHRILLASIGFFAAGIMVFVASNLNTTGPLVLFFAIAVFCQSAYAAQEYAIVQRLLSAEHIGAGTGLYNGLSVLLGGVGGSLIPGSIVAATGSFNGAIFSIVVGAFAAALVLLVLARMLKY